MLERLVAEFGAVDGAIAGAARVRALGCEDVEAFTPYPVPELEVRLGIGRTKIPVAAFVAGTAGAFLAHLVMWWTNAVDYPINVGGRPPRGLPAHVPIMFETAVLFAAATTFVLALVLSGLPRLHHPVFELEGFERTTLDKFWIAASCRTPELADEAASELTRAGAVHVRRIGAAS